jgi:hypothetical protein
LPSTKEKKRLKKFTPRQERQIHWSTRLLNEAAKQYEIC